MNCCGVTSISDGPDSDGPDFDGPDSDMEPFRIVVLLCKELENTYVSVSNNSSWWKYHGYVVYEGDAWLVGSNVLKFQQWTESEADCLAAIVTLPLIIGYIVSLAALWVPVYG